jgi:hypothetical protein
MGSGLAMSKGQITAIVQRYLDAVAGDHISVRDLAAHKPEALAKGGAVLRAGASGLA